MLAGDGHTFFSNVENTLNITFANKQYYFFAYIKLNKRFFYNLLGIKAPWQPWPVQTFMAGAGQGCHLCALYHKIKN